MPEMDQHACGPLTHQPHQSNLSLHLTLTHVSELFPESPDKFFKPEGCVKYVPVITVTKKTDLWCNKPGVNSRVLANRMFVCM